MLRHFQNRTLNSGKEPKDIFTEYLKSGNHRITPERFEVLNFALNKKGHFAADELYADMKKNKSNISRATVYNTLELLVDCQLLVQRNFGDGKTTYESNFKRKAHDHLICTNCGEIIEFSAPEIEEIVKRVCDELGFIPSGYSFNIFGICKDEESCEIKKRKRNG